MHTKLMAGVMVLALPCGVLAADATPDATPADTKVSQPAQQTTASIPPAPHGPFFSRRMMAGRSGAGQGGVGQGGVGQGGANQGGFPPMGFDPMTNASPQATPTPGQMTGRPGNVYGNTVRGGTGGGTEVQVQIRGRIGMGGGGSGNGGYGNNGYGNNGFGTRGMPYGMPYGQGYGAPYGTPYNQANNASQYAPQAPLPPAPNDGIAADATAQRSVQNQAQNQARNSPHHPPSNAAPYPWTPGGMAMVNPGGFFAQRQPSQAAGVTANAPQPPAQPQEPQWVKDRRAEAEKRREEAQQRFADMQKNNPYAQRFRQYAQPYGQGYGAPYGARYGQPYGYAPQRQSAPQGGEDGGSKK